MKKLIHKNEDTDLIIPTQNTDNYSLSSNNSRSKLDNNLKTTDIIDSQSINLSNTYYQNNDEIVYYYIHSGSNWYYNQYKLLKNDSSYTYTYNPTENEINYAEAVFIVLDPKLKIDFQRTYNEESADIRIYAASPYSVAQNKGSYDVLGYVSNIGIDSGYVELVINYGIRDQPNEQMLKTYVHEVGHALGLRHPKDDPTNINWNSDITIMSYNDSTNSGFTTLDHLALQKIWGSEYGIIGKANASILGQKYSLSEIKDYDGNPHGILDNAPVDVITGYKFQGGLDVNNDGILEDIYTNHHSGRWATVSQYWNNWGYDYDFSKHGKGGTTRIVGIYEDPLVKAGLVEKNSVFDGSRTFINDLKLDNLILEARGDYNGDGFQEVYWSKVDNTAYLRAVMHTDGNIQYANYQNLDQMTNYLTFHGFADTAAYIS